MFPLRYINFHNFSPKTISLNKILILLVGCDTHQWDYLHFYDQQVHFPEEENYFRFCTTNLHIILNLDEAQIMVE
jgi:hypothetical protein